METIKHWVLAHFEAILILIISMALLAINFFVDQKLMFLNFYYLPVLISGYFLGRRQTISTSLFIIGLIAFFVFFDPPAYFKGEQELQVVLNIVIWAGFLFLAAYTVGTLYEQKQKKIEDLNRAYIGVVEILSKYLDASDRYTKGHSVRVADYATEIARAMDLPHAEVENIRVAGLLHDIGKIEISSEIINKAADLTAEEKRIMGQHAEKGAKILASVGGVLKDAIRIVLFHHRYFIEKSDKEGKEMPLGARILAVADSFDAMVSDRPYRKGRSFREAFLELERCSGTQFDPNVVEGFKRVMPEIERRAAEDLQPVGV
jgi:putative nucleotidyltransferase with HDIG domain